MKKKEKVAKYAKRFLTLLCVMFLAGILLPGMRAEAGAKKEALKAYAQFLKSKPTEYGFMLAYIDGDDVPELVVDGCLYSYKSGSVQHIEYSSMSVLYGFYGKTGILCTIYSHSSMYGSVDCTYYVKYSNGKYSEKLTKIYFNPSMLSSGTKKVTYENAKGNNISKTKFQRQLKKLVGTKKMTKFKYHKNTAANRKKYLK